MRHLALLAAIYALIVALVLPGSLLASEEASPVAAEGDPPGDVSAQTAPDPAPAGTPPDTSPAEAAPPPAPAAPAPAAAPAPVPAEPAPGTGSPPVQELGEERDLDEPVAKAAASTTVTVRDFDFAPAQITVNQGDTVTWVNEGPTPHSATASDGSFDTGIYGAGQSRSHTFDQAGTFAYICTPHPYMRGTVVVQAAQSGSGTGGAGDSGSSDSGTAATGDGAAGAAAADTGPTLPNSGADSWVLLLLGAMMLALGVAVHRQASPQG